MAGPLSEPANSAFFDSAENRGLCLQDGIQPCIRGVGERHGSGLGAVRCIVEHDGAWLLANKRLDRRQDRLGRVILALLTAACIFVRRAPAVNRVRRQGLLDARPGGQLWRF